MAEVTVMQRWMKHREKQGVWHVCKVVEIGGTLSINTGRPTTTYVTACRGDMLFGSIGPIVQQFAELPKSPKCVRCTQIYLDANTVSPTE
jgi:hypothetical protein